MNVLDKILDEINVLIEKHKNKDYELAEKEQLTQCYTETDIEQIKVHELAAMKEIIRSHMDDAKNMNTRFNDEPYILLTINENGVAEEYDDTYDITIHCGSEKEKDRVSKSLENYHDWISVDDTEHIPKNESYVLVSFSNSNSLDIARYEENEGGGTYYPGCDEESYLKYGLFVNAWQPLPEPYKEGK